MLAVFVALLIAAPAAAPSAQCDSKPFTLGSKPQTKPAATAPEPAPPKLAEAKPPAKKPTTSSKVGVPGCKTDKK